MFIHTQHDIAKVATRNAPCGMKGVAIFKHQLQSSNTNGQKDLSPFLPFKYHRIRWVG
jgi:hypothetical protein